MSFIRANQFQPKENLTVNIIPLISLLGLADILFIGIYKTSHYPYDISSWLINKMRKVNVTIK